METVLLVVIIVILIITLFFSYKASNLTNDSKSIELKNKIESISNEINRIEASVKNEIATNRSETNDASRNTREELGNSLKSFGDLISGSIKNSNDLQKNQLESFSNYLNALTKTIEDKLNNLITTVDGKFVLFNENSNNNSKESRKELKENLDSFKVELNMALKDFSDRQRDNFSELQKNLNTQNTTATTKLDAIRDTVERKITQLQEGNEKKLDDMRKTVDEKLDETLEKRLGESFKLVSERLEAVHKGLGEGLGEMQNLTKNVGSLNKVMSNVKSRGVLGEYQLQNLLEDLLTNEQYERNVKTKIGSGAIVEFAVKMPHGNNYEKTLWLPIDSKFPKEDYEALVDAYEKGDLEKIEEIRKAFVKGIRKSAQDIKEKYIDPPNTTEYGIMFLPYESLFAEVLRTPGLFEQLQKDYKITITGPTTLSALLNSLQMGFRTLAIEKRSGEVWDLLSAVKTEFNQFGAILEKTKKKLEEATNTIDKAGVRSRAIERQLRKVQELPSTETIAKVEQEIVNDSKDIQDDLENLIVNPENEE